MDKAILKKFAIESKQDLMDKIRSKIKTFYVDGDFKNEQKGEVYILSNENSPLSLTNDMFKKRELLIKRINDSSIEQVIEEAAYTWFNRIIAIRYMELNEILPLTKDNQSLGIRVLSSKDNTPDPEILKFSNLINPDLDINFDKEKYITLKSDNKKFEYILLLICQKLGNVIPQVFDGATDYIDILIPDNLLNDTGFVAKLINEVPENNFEQVEIIGWLYQYYNQVEKDKVISSRKAYKKNEIAYATQLFTPDWIVKYMVENTLGKYWIENGGNSSIKSNWNYFIDDVIVKNDCKISPDEISFIDPCCGSGHILVYAFEILYQMYVSVGYNKTDIPELILENNLYGLDIDDRAGQLSVLSVLLKAREYDKNIFNKDIAKRLNVISIQESNTISNSVFDYISDDFEKEKLVYLVESFKNAKEIGSLLILENKNYEDLKNIIENDDTIFGIEMRNKIIPLINVANILSNKYDVVVTNPPYMNNNVMSNNLKKYIYANYSDVKSDMFSAFVLKNSYLSKDETYLGFMTPYVWMFISSYEKLREYIIDRMNISSLIQLEYSALEEATVPICSFTLKNSYKNGEKGNYYRLVDFKGGMNVQENAYLKILNNGSSKYHYKKDIKQFKETPNMVISYWLTDNLINIFKNSKKINEVSEAKQGMTTSDNKRFLRLWYEVDTAKIGFGMKGLEEAKKSCLKWFPYNKGGEYRKWFGNDEYVVNYYNDGEEMEAFHNELNKTSSGGRIKNKEYYFKKCISWSKISSASLAFRFKDDGFIFDVAGSSIFTSDNDLLLYILGLFNSKLGMYIIGQISPTLNFEAEQIKQMPFEMCDNNKDKIIELVKKSIEISKEDWNSFETSWDFARHPLLKPMSKVSTIRNSIANWNTYTYQQRSVLKHNEEELNRIFIDIYGLNNELTPIVDDKDITIRKEDKTRDIKSFISYAVGCMFGRYSLDKDGLIYAGGDFDNVYQKYKKTDGDWAGSSLSNYKYLNDNGNEIELSFEVDNDNIIPITDETYFSDDIVERFKTFIKTVYGDNTFNENMDFIAEALGKKGTETSEETIRRYFVNDFFNDHCKIYQKRPIYWLLDSGKKNGFKALIYMHRYDESLIPRARINYLHRVQTAYENLLSDINYKLTTDLSMVDKKNTLKRQADLNAKIQEIKEYDEKIAHIANQRISIDLDDGVKVNYEKFKDILAKIK